MTSALGGRSAAPALRGSQVPRIWSVPPSVGSAGKEAVDLARMAGLNLDPWQAFVLEHSLGERLDGAWAALEVALIVGRQNGKGSILEARELAGLFLLGEQMIMHSAHIFDTALEAFRRVLGLIEQTPELDSRVKRVSRSHGEEGIELKTGQRLRFKARTLTGGRGFSGDCVILDEAMQLRAEHTASLVPTLSARPNPQLWYTGSAPLPDSDVLYRLRERGRTADPGRLAYFEWSAAENANRNDPASVAVANPAIGLDAPDHGLGWEFIVTERAALGEVEWARERLGITPDESVQCVFEPGVWSACVESGSQIEGPPTFAVGVSNDRSWSCIAAAGTRSDGKRHVEVIENRRGTAWVARRCSELIASWGGDVFLNPSSPAASLKQDFDDAGIAYREVTGNEMNQACGLFYDEVVEGALRHLDQQVLNVAVSQAVTRPSGDGAWVWSQSKSLVDISPLIAVTLAGWACAESLSSPSVFLA